MVMMFTVKSAMPKMKKVERIDVGIASATMIVARQDSRKKNVMLTTRTTANTRSKSTSLIEDSMKREMSLATTRRMPGGASFWSSATSAITAFATSIVLRPD